MCKTCTKKRRWKRNNLDTIPKGEEHPNATVKTETVKKIIEMFAAGKRQVDIANKLNLSKQYVSKVLKGDRRRSETNVEPQSGQAVGSKNGTAKLTEKEVLEIREIREETNKSYAKIAEQFGVTPMVIHNIIKRKSWKHI